MPNRQLTILCIASYEKGFEFIKEAKRQGCRVILLTSKSLEFADWPRESIDEIFFIPDINKEWNMSDVIHGVSFLARNEVIDRIVALDDFDVEKAATLREHLRCPGMGETTARYFRDKLAMRIRAKEVGINVPEFVHVLNYNNLREYINNTPLPYVLKPRLQAGAIGIKKIHKGSEVWDIIETLGDKQSFYLLERFVPGNIYHVDSIIHNEKVVFSIASQYALPPMEVAHQGRVFSTHVMERGSGDEQELISMNKNVLKALGLRYGVSHTEFIKAEDGKFYFLETSARVGGANIAEMIEAATGINLWSEWAKVEIARTEGNYKLPKISNDYAGILISLARQEWPNLSSYDAPEVYWKMNKKYHAGLIIKSKDFKKVESLMNEYTQRFYNDFFATQPLPDKPTD